MNARCILGYVRVRRSVGTLLEATSVNAQEDPLATTRMCALVRHGFELKTPHTSHLRTNENQIAPHRNTCDAHANT